MFGFGGKDKEARKIEKVVENSMSNLHVVIDVKDRLEELAELLDDIIHDENFLNDPDNAVQLMAEKAQEAKQEWDRFPQLLHNIAAAYFLTFRLEEQGPVLREKIHSFIKENT